MRIGILTGGGDVPGLNSVIKSVTYRATEIDAEVVGIRRGWEGLTHLDGADDPRYVMPLDRRNTRPIDRTGGTVLHTSRTNPRKMRGSRLPNGLSLRRVRVPLGVVGVVYEARPNVTIDAAALCLKSGNAVVLRGSSSAAHSNAVLAGGPGADRLDGGSGDDELRGGHAVPRDRVGRGRGVRCARGVEPAVRARR